MSDYRIGMEDPLSNFTPDQWNKMAQVFPDPGMRKGFLEFLAKDVAGGRGATAATLQGKADRIQQIRGKGGTAFNIKDGTNVGDAAQTAPPHDPTVKPSRSGYAVNLKSVEDHTFTVDGEPRSGKEIEAVLRKARKQGHEKMAQGVMSRNGITHDEKTDTYSIMMDSETSAFNTMFPSQGGNSAAKSAFEILGSPWNIALMSLPVVGNLFGMWVGAKAMKAFTNGSGGFGDLMGAGAGMTAAGALGGFGMYGTAASAAGFMGYPGMALSMKKIMRSYAEDFKDQSLMGMINNPGIPIEDLLAYFMAYMAEKYEDKLRDKMEEVAMAEKKERERENSKMQGRLLGGLVTAAATTFTGGLGSAAAQVGGQMVEGFFQKKQEIKDAVDGNVQSSTLLMQELQVLMQKWKQLNEMCSNLLKNLHEMTMTPIRNLR